MATGTVSRRALGVLLGVIAVIAALAVLALLTEFVFPVGSFPGDKTLQRQFILDNENNIPTWFSSALFLAGAGLCTLLARLEPRRRRGWTGLAIVFLVLSADETASLHEAVNSTLRAGLGLHGALRFAWLLPAFVVLVILGAVYAGFLWHLPRATRFRLAVSAIVYLAGAVGSEMVGGWYWDAVGDETLGYGIITTVEELLEMVGLALLVYALTAHAERLRPKLVTTVDPHDEQDSRGPD